MEVALTFGSLGDIIALCQLAVQLGRAVGVGGKVGESAKEYQQLRLDLDTLVRILMEVVATFQQHEISEELKVLDDATRSVVDQCASLIQDTLDRLQPRYHSSLSREVSGTKIKRAYKSIQWRVSEPERLRCLQEKIQEGVQRLSLLVGLATRKSARIDHAAMLARTDEIQTRVTQTCTNQAEILRLLQQANERHVKKLDHVSQQLVKQSERAQSLLAIAKDALSNIIEIKGLLIRVSQNVANIHMPFNSIYLDPTKELPVTLEDALGRHIEISAQWLDFLQWETFCALISDRFKNHNGYEMVTQRRYVLEDSASGRDLRSDWPLSACLRRGMKVNMSMIFQIEKITIGVCPRCKEVTDAVEGITVQCPRYDCAMWFQVYEPFTSILENGMKIQATLGLPIVTSALVEPANFHRVRLAHWSADHGKILSYLKRQFLKRKS
ncbi:hypothetical protein NM208_g13315 [Fusarium decemcellulare]|uniref:Uncharacterized protein n=1 Tax=Fusarium decemcellulare TaxID=57161 RepID=A0ACC1RKB4_9HYPO|nr:hypothetical protein NM208_g13315 [Fusarium decemcellulare]